MRISGENGGHFLNLLIIKKMRIIIMTTTIIPTAMPALKIPPMISQPANVKTRTLKRMLR
jgi:hypothetical protein